MSRPIVREAKSDAHEPIVIAVHGLAELRFDLLGVGIHAVMGSDPDGPAVCRLHLVGGKAPRRVVRPPPFDPLALLVKQGACCRRDSLSLLSLRHFLSFCLPALGGVTGDPTRLKYLAAQTILTLIGLVGDFLEHRSKDDRERLCPVSKLSTPN